MHWKTEQRTPLVLRSEAHRRGLVILEPEPAVLRICGRKPALGKQAQCYLDLTILKDYGAVVADSFEVVTDVCDSRRSVGLTSTI